MAELDSSKLFRIRKTVNKMLHDRGYVVSEEDISQTKEQARMLRCRRSVRRRRRRPQGRCGR